MVPLGEKEALPGTLCTLISGASQRRSREDQTECSDLGGGEGGILPEAHTENPDRRESGSRIRWSSQPRQGCRVFPRRDSRCFVYAEITNQPACVRQPTD